MATFTELLAGITDPHERAVLAARIYCDPTAYAVDFVAPRVFKYKGWTLTVTDLFLGLDGQCIGLGLQVVTAEGVTVPLDNPFYIVNPFYVDETGVENPVKAFTRMVVDALHDAAVKAGFEPPF